MLNDSDRSSDIPSLLDSHDDDDSWALPAETHHDYSRKLSHSLTKKFISVKNTRGGVQRPSVVEGKLRRQVQKLLSSDRFNALIACVIILNAAFLGVETDLNDRNSKDDDMAWLVLEIAFTVIFVIEVVLRLIVDGIGFFWDLWNLFDLVVVTTAVLDNVTALSGSDSSLSSSTILRIFRVFRLARIVRLLRFFKELWLLVTGILAAVRFLFWVWVLLILVIYVFAVFTTRMFGQQHTENEDVQRYFANVPISMFSLFQIMTTEGWAEIAYVMLAAEPYSIAVILIFMSITTFAMVNVVVAVIVDSTLNQAQEMRTDANKIAEQDERDALTRVVHVFRKADEDNDGTLTKAEFTAALELDSVKKLLRAVNIDLSDADELFDILDTDESGQLNPQEFVHGVLRARGDARSKDLLELQCDLWKCYRAADLEVRDMGDRLTKLEEQHHASDDRLRQALSALEQGASEGFRQLELAGLAVAGELPEPLDLRSEDTNTRIRTETTNILSSDWNSSTAFGESGASFRHEGNLPHCPDHLHQPQCPSHEDGDLSPQEEKEDSELVLEAFRMLGDLAGRDGQPSSPRQ